MKARFLDVGGVETRILYAGDPTAYPLLLIHGGGVAADTWVRNIDALAEDFFVVAPDLVGHGFTRPVDFEGGAPHPKTVAHLTELVTSFGWERFCASGSSYGALIAVLLYLDLPDKVDQLIINGSGSVFNPPDDHAKALKGTLANSMSAFDEPTTENCRKRLANILFDRESVPDEVAHMQITQYALPWARQAWIETLTAMMSPAASDKYRVLDRLHEIQADTLIVWGREDPRGHLRNAESAIGRIPKAQLAIIEQCGHMPYMERPQEYNAIVRDFLKPRVSGRISHAT